MSHTIRFNQELGVIVLRVKQRTDVSELQKALAEVVHLPGFVAGLSLVIDFRGCDAAFSGEDMRRLARYCEVADAQWGKTKWSILTSNDVAFGLSRMFGTLTDTHRVTTHAFRSLVEADDWLGLGVEMDEILARTPDGEPAVG